MAMPNILNRKDFTLSQFTPGVGGDSGALTLATLTADPRVQYVIKSGFPEIACNEFMYHHVAAALGLYTQETNLFMGMAGAKYAVAIRYVPNAIKFSHDEADERSRRTFYEFKTLYVILNEEDSEELYYDGQDRVFKLDNAASFNLSQVTVENVLKCGSKESPGWVWRMLINGLNLIEYDKYRINLQILNKYFGSQAAETGCGMIKRFAEFDESCLAPACETLEKMYPLAITEYYPAFIKLRKEACKRFLKEHNVTAFTEARTE